jgi:hypothetical protein
MDGLIQTAWRAFWIGLGASAVLIGQSVITLPQPGPATVPGDPALAPLGPVAPPAAPLAPAAARRKSADPLSVRCESIGHGLRCS